MENQVKQLKINITNINSFLKKSNKDYIKLRKKNKRLEYEKKESTKKLNKEKKIEKKSLKSPLTGVAEVAKTPMSIFDKIFNFGILLLGGFLVNALPGIIKKVEEFKEKHKETINSVVGILSNIKDGIVGLFDSFTGPSGKEGAFDNIAKFSDDGKLIGGALREVEKAYDELDKLIAKVDKLMGGKTTLAKKDGVEGEISQRTGIFTPKQFTPEERKRYEKYEATRSARDIPTSGSTEEDSQFPEDSNRRNDHSSGSGGGPQSSIPYTPGKGKSGRRIFLHWSAGGYNDAASAYHSIVLGDGTVVRHTPYDQDKYSHTGGGNDNSVGLSVAAMAGATENNFGSYPVKDIQIQKMVLEAAKLAVDWGWSEANIRNNVRTHGEWERYATRRGHLPGKPQRWDLDKLYESDPNVDLSKDLSSGGDRLRKMIIKEYNNLKKKKRTSTSTTTTTTSTNITSAQIISPSTLKNSGVSLGPISSSGEENETSIWLLTQPVIPINPYAQFINK